MYSYISDIDREIFDKYGDRKTANILALIFDCKKTQFLPVPRTIEHVQLVEMLLKIKAKDITSKKLDLSFLVPVTFAINSETYEIRKLLTGISGIEMGYGVRHSHKQLQDAHHAALYVMGRALEKGQFSLATNFQAIMSTRFAKE